MSTVNLLLVDDEPQVIAMYKRWFQSSRYKIHEALSAIAANQIVKRLKEEDENALLVVLLDEIIPPGQDGISVLKKVKYEFPFSKVYIITGNLEVPRIPNVAYETGVNLGDGFFLKQTLTEEMLMKAVEQGITEQENQYESLKEE